MPESTTSSQVLPIIQLMSCISKTLVNGLYVVDLQMKSGMTSVSFMRIFMGMLFVPLLFFHSFCVPEQSQVFINNFNVLHQCHGMTSLLSFLISFPLCLCPTPSPSPSDSI